MAGYVFSLLLKSLVWERARPGADLIGCLFETVLAFESGALDLFHGRHVLVANHVERDYSVDAL